MSKLDDFFSIEKIEYPILASVFFGVFLRLIEMVLKININEEFYWFIMLLGFILGNFYKIKIIENSNKHK